MVNGIMERLSNRILDVVEILFFKGQNLQQADRCAERNDDVDVDVAVLVRLPPDERAEYTHILDPEILRHILSVLRKGTLYHFKRLHEVEDTVCREK